MAAPKTPKGPLLGRHWPEKAKCPEEVWMVTARLNADMVEAKTREHRRQLDVDLAAIYETDEWQAACALVAETRQAVNMADFGVNPEAMPGLLKKNEEAKAARDLLIQQAHEDYHRKCEE